MNLFIGERTFNFLICLCIYFKLLVWGYFIKIVIFCQYVGYFIKWIFHLTAEILIKRGHSVHEFLICLWVKVRMRLEFEAMDQNMLRSTQTFCVWVCLRLRLYLLNVSILNCQSHYDCWENIKMSACLKHTQETCWFTYLRLVNQPL